MKKILSIVLIFFMIFAITGCTNSNTEAYLAKKINKNMTNLLQAINNLEQVTDEDITISEFTSGQSTAQKITYRVNRLSKIKQLIGKNNSLNIKDLNDANRTTPKYMHDKQIYESKYISNDNINNENNYFNVFKTKIDNLYNVCNDCNYINGECTRLQNELKTSIEECKSLCQKLESKEITLNKEQLQICNTYANQINHSCSKIKDCKGDCKNYLQTLKSLKSYFGSNTDTLTNNYLNLLGCLENRVSCYSEALECVNNCNNLLKSNYEPIENNETSNIDLQKNDTISHQNLEKEPIISNNNNNNYNNNNNFPNNNINKPIINSNNPYNNGYNSNNGYYNYGYNGYYGNNPYNQTPNNVNTYGPINKNIDTYGGYNGNYAYNTQNTVVNDENKTLNNNENNKLNTTIKTNDEKQDNNIIENNSNENNLVENSTKIEEAKIMSNNLKEEKFVNSEIKTINNKPNIKSINDNQTLNNKEIEEKVQEINKTEPLNNKENNNSQQINNDIKVIKNKVDDLNEKIENNLNKQAMQI